jgi:hypothetical protein
VARPGSRPADPGWPSLKYAQRALWRPWRGIAMTTTLLVLMALFAAEV